MPTIYGMAPFVATEAIPQYTAVKAVGASGIELLDGATATDFAWGIAQTAAASGEAVDVETRPGYQTRVIAGAAFSVGAELMASTAVPGRLIARTSGKFCVCVAMEEATDAGQIVKAVTVFSKVVGA